MTFEALTYNVQDGIAVVTLNRPKTRNALDIAMRTELAQVVDIMRDDAGLSACVITGAGGAFCAGGDLKALSEARRPVTTNRKRIQDLHTWFPKLVDLELPVIAAVDGPAFGAGLNLALAADFIVATPRARFCAVFGRIGLVPDLGGFFLLPRIVGLQAAKDLVFTARSIDAEEAKRLGIVKEIVPADELMQHALYFAGHFKNASRTAIGMAKSILNRSSESDQMTLSELESYAQAVCMESDYHRDAVGRFLNKEQLAFDWDRDNDG